MDLPVRSLATGEHMNNMIVISRKMVCFRRLLWQIVVVCCWCCWCTVLVLLRLLLPTLLLPIATNGSPSVLVPSRWQSLSWYLFVIMAILCIFFFDCLEIKFILKFSLFFHRFSAFFFVFVSKHLSIIFSFKMKRKKLFFEHFLVNVCGTFGRKETKRQSKITVYAFYFSATHFILFVYYFSYSFVCVCLKLKLADSSKFIPVQPQFLSVTNLRNEIENKRM